MTPTQPVRLTSVLTCSGCRQSHAEQKQMPTAPCQWFYECPGCHTVLKPLAGACCVYCSYGSGPCPPVQEQGKGACGGG